MEKEDRIIEMLEKQNETLEKHSQMLQEHSQTLQEHGQILNALRSGQEHLKAEVDGFKTSTQEGFSELKQEQTNITSKVEVLRKDTWMNKVDIQRVKNTMGME